MAAAVEVSPNNLEVGTAYFIEHRVHAGGAKHGRFEGFVAPAEGFESPRCKFAMLDSPGTRSFQPENWKFFKAEEPAQAGGRRRRRNTRRSRRARRTTRRRL